MFVVSVGRNCCCVSEFSRHAKNKERFLVNRMKVESVGIRVVLKEREKEGGGGRKRRNILKEPGKRKKVREKEKRNKVKEKEGEK